MYYLKDNMITRDGADHTICMMNHTHRDSTPEKDGQHIIDALNNREVKIIIRGGNAEVTECPNNIKVEIIDYDNNPNADNPVTRVVFRTWNIFEIIALFPDDKENNNLIGSYMHVGQHGGADYDHVIKDSRPASIDEYSNLKEELESIGYNLEVVDKA